MVPDIGRFCKEAPESFTDHQIASFRVFSNAGIVGLRAHLNAQLAMEGIASDDASTRRGSDSSSSSVTVPGETPSPPPGRFPSASTITSPTSRRSVPAFRSRGQRQRWGDTMGIPGSAFSGSANFLAPEIVPSSSRIHPRGSTSSSRSREVDGRGIRTTSHRHNPRLTLDEGRFSSPTRDGNSSGASPAIYQRLLPRSLERDLIDLNIDNVGTIPGGFSLSHAASRDDDTLRHSDEEDEDDKARFPYGSPSRQHSYNHSSRSPFKWIAGNYRRWGTAEGNRIVRGGGSGSGSGTRESLDERGP